MCAQLTVTSGCQAQTGWTGTVAFNIGTIQREHQSTDTGLELITRTLGNSSQALAINILGQFREIRLMGRYVASSLADAQNFDRNLQLIAKYQLTVGATTTVFYYNDKSKIYDVSHGTGIRTMVKKIDTDSTSEKNPLVVDYVITLWECVNI